MWKSLIGAALLCTWAGSFATAQVTFPPGSTFPGSTAGSTESIDEIREGDSLRLGPVYVDPVIRLKEFGIDSNVFNQSGEAASDFTFTVSPEAAMALPVARLGLVKATVGADLVYFAHYVSERSVDPQITLRAEGYTRRFTVFLQESYLNTRQRPNYEIDVRARHLENDLSGGTAIRVTSKVSAEVAAHREVTRFDGDAYFDGQNLKETLDRDTNRYRVATFYAHSVLTTVGLLAEYQSDRFTESPVRDTDSFRVMPGVALKPRALVNGGAWIGYRRISPKSPVLRSQAGLVSRLGLSYTLLGATVFGVTYDRDYQFSYEADTPYFLDKGVGVSVRRALSGRFDVIVNAARHHYHYQPFAFDVPDLVSTSIDVDAILTPVETTPSRIDTIRGYGINLGYRLRRESRIGFDISHWTRRSTDGARRDYDDFRIGLTMAYEL